MKANAEWATPAERSDFVSTPNYADTRAWLERLVAASPLLSLEVFGTSSEGRDLLLVRARKGAAGKPVVLAQAGIHAGEIDGKDAGLMLLRDIAQGGKDALLDQVDFVFVPILNVDGHEQRGPLVGAALRGPQGAGWNSTPRGINLNRDYLNLETPEARAVVALLHRLDPALYIDLHVSEGLDHQYDITYTFAGWGTYARSRATAGWLQQRFTPAVDAALRTQGHTPTIYPSLIDENDPRSGLRYSPEGPRYSTGYGDFAGIPTVLVENHRLKSYRQRVLGDYVLLEVALRLVARDATRIAAAKRTDRAARPAELMVAWERLEQPIAQLPFKGVTYTRALSPASGRQELRWEGRDATWTMPVVGYRQTQAVTYPQAWWIPPGNADVVARLMPTAFSTSACSSHASCAWSAPAWSSSPAATPRTARRWKKPLRPAAFAFLPTSRCACWPPPCWSRKAATRCWPAACSATPATRTAASRRRAGAFHRTHVATRRSLAQRLRTQARR